MTWKTPVELADARATGAERSETFRRLTEENVRLRTEIESRDKLTERARASVAVFRSGLSTAPLHELLVLLQTLSSKALAEGRSDRKYAVILAVAQCDAVVDAIRSHEDLTNVVGG